MTTLSGMELNVIFVLGNFVNIFGFIKGISSILSLNMGQNSAFFAFKSILKKSSGENPII